MNENETYQFDERVYLSPETSRDEQMEFIDTLRGMQTANNQQIYEQTHALGTQAAQPLGGLDTGSTNPNSYFMRRYQTPQVNSQVSALKSAAQLSALNQLLANEQAQYQKQYKDAQYAAARRARNSNNPANNPSTTDDEENTVETSPISNIFYERGQGVKRDYYETLEDWAKAEYLKRKQQEEEERLKKEEGKVQLPNYTLQYDENGKVILK